MQTEEELLKIKENLETKKVEQEKVNLSFKQEEERLRNLVIKSYIKNNGSPPTEIEISEDLEYIQRVKKRLLDKGIDWDTINWDKIN